MQHKLPSFWRVLLVCAVCLVLLLFRACIPSEPLPAINSSAGLEQQQQAWQPEDVQLQQQMQQQQSRGNLSVLPRIWWLDNPPALLLRHETPPERVASLPFVTGDTLRALADHIVDDSSQPLRIRDVQDGDVIFVKTDRLPRFITNQHPHIRATYILVTHNSADAVPTSTRGPCKNTSLCLSLLNAPTLHWWYGQNMQPGFDRTTPIPLGLANRMWPHGDAGFIAAAARAAPPWGSRRTRLYLAMKLRTNKNRGRVVQAMAAVPGAVLQAQRVPWQQYVREMVDARFVAAPPGRGFDTHRAWEAIYLGAVPILQSGPLDALYEGLPVLIVQDYRNVTDQLLTEFEVSFAQQLPGSTQKAWALFWWQELQQRKQQLHRQQQAVYKQ